MRLDGHFKKKLWRSLEPKYNPERAMIGNEIATLGKYHGSSVTWVYYEDTIYHFLAPIICKSVDPDGCEFLKCDALRNCYDWRNGYFVNGQNIKWLFNILFYCISGAGNMDRYETLKKTLVGSDSKRVFVVSAIDNHTRITDRKGNINSFVEVDDLSDDVEVMADINRNEL